VADVHAHRWPEPDWFAYDRIGWFEDDSAEYLPVAEWAAKRRGVIRIAGGFDPVFSRVMDLCGMERGLMLMAASPQVVHALIGHIADFLDEYYRRLAQAGQGHIDFIGFGDDFAGQAGMLISPRMWREYFMDVWKRLFAVAHAYGMKASLHSCGAVRPVLGDLIDAGLDVFEVVQVTANGMGPVDLKREFGSHLTFYGGMDTQHILPHASPEAVRSEVRRLADTLGKNGRFILANMHLLMEDVPTANVLAMYDEARRYEGKSSSNNTESD
jgi:uroporphyrinogen decarboxylase